MSLPTAKLLIEQLRTIYSGDGPRLTNEDLAARLPITLSTFNRWRKADTHQFAAAITMLAAAGWLSDEALTAAEPTEESDDPLDLATARLQQERCTPRRETGT